MCFDPVCLLECPSTLRMCRPLRNQPSARQEASPGNHASRVNNTLSQFDTLVGYTFCRAPYDNIFTAEGITLRARAAMLPPLAEGDIGIMSARGPRRVSHSRSRGNAVQHSGQLGGIADG